MNTILKVQNLKCGGCANTITTKISKLKGLKNIKIDVESSSIAFNYDNEQTLIETRQLLTKIGYPVIGEKNPLTTKAKSFVSCAVGRINKV